MKLNTAVWLRISIFNLFIVAFLGTLMRYKIGFPFPYFDQKNLQHAHSHFAFIGWVTHTLFVLMVGILQKDQPLLKVNKYRSLIIVNLVCAYGMIFSFIAQGYGAVSITLSTLSIFVAYVFAAYMFADLKRGGDRPYRYWFTAALWFNIIASLGTFTLAFMMASHNFNQKLHLASLYYYLHFQYNGFFMFACMGILFSGIRELLPAYRFDNRIFWLFFGACVPAYFLSVLWIKMPLWLYVIVVLAAVAQVIAWLIFLGNIRKALPSRTALFERGKYLLLIVALALSVKLLLQLGSTIPAVSKLAFGFRSVIIAYLHLVLLAIISVFLVAYLYISGLIRSNRASAGWIMVFVVGVYINELILGIQGIASFSYTPVPYGNESLFFVSLCIMLSVAGLLAAQWQKRGHLTAS